MDQVKIGSLLKELRKEKGMTQAQLAEKCGVSDRSVSRWENGVTMPDFDIMIELAKLYDVQIEEILTGERRNNMEPKEEKTMRTIAEYTNEKTARLIRNMHFFACVGLVSWLVWLGLVLAGLSESGVTENIASFAAGLAFAMSILAAVYTTVLLRQTRRKQEKLQAQ
ncbi:MAG: helix-turn-helix domain-containing protein [Solobacterium sp.]|nr:helix-turn-helix domain-containing protein [Solobacterium sp.]